MKKYLFLFLVLLHLTSCQERHHPAIVLEQQLLQHPRLLYTGDEEKNVVQLIQSEPLMEDLRKKLFQEAGKLLTAPVQKYDKDNEYQYLRPVCVEQVYRMITLSLAYRLTGDKRYAQKVEEELVNVCSFPDWNPENFLDLSEMTTAVAVAYDWLNDVLLPATKELVVATIKTYAVDIAIEEYNTGNSGSPLKRETNWNVVCNSGMILGALAIADHYPDEAGRVIENAVRFLPNCLMHFAPDGVCYEGPGYWDYTNIYLSLMLKALNDNFGHDFGISDWEGINKTALYYIHSVSPSGRVFNFANSGGTSPTVNPTYFFFSKHFNQPEVAAFYRQVLSSKLDELRPPRHFFLALPWFDSATFDQQVPLPKMKLYRGINDIVVFNGNKNTPDFIYLIAKGGEPTKAHQQMDVGTFIIETNGVRWSDDLGADDYSLEGFWDYKPGGQRWSYFRNANFSHNTLVIDGKIQYSAGNARVVACDEKAVQPYATIDMTGVYVDQAKSVRRTFRLLDDTHMVVTDSVELLSPSQTLEWSMISGAAISCSGNRATLTRDGKQFFLKIYSPATAVFVTKEAKSFTEAERPVVGYQRLTVPVKGQQKQVIEIQMSSREL